MGIYIYTCLTPETFSTTTDLPEGSKSAKWTVSGPKHYVRLLARAVQSCLGQRSNQGGIIQLYGPS